MCSGIDRRGENHDVAAIQGKYPQSGEKYSLLEVLEVLELLMVCVPFLQKVINGTEYRAEATQQSERELGQEVWTSLITRANND